MIGGFWDCWIGGFKDWWTEGIWDVRGLLDCRIGESGVYRDMGIGGLGDLRIGR